MDSDLGEGRRRIHREVVSVEWKEGTGKKPSKYTLRKKTRRLSERGPSAGAPGGPTQKDKHATETLTRQRS